MSNLNKEVKITTADPSALGLFGLAIVTLVASSSKLGWTNGISLVLPWAIFLGAFAQLFACINDCKRNNVFGTTAFGGYALFWFGIAMSWLIQNGVFGEKLAASVDPKQFAFAYLGYFVFTLFMTLASVETNKVLFIIFVLIDFLFIGLAGSAFGMGEIFHDIAAYSELLISIMAFYGFAANVINATFGRVFLPLGKPFGIFKK